MNIGNNISVLRQAAGLNQQELAQRLGISKVAICLYESNKRKTPVFILKAIADALAIPRSVLLVDFDDKPPYLSPLASEDWDYLQELFAKTCTALMLARARKK